VPKQFRDIAELLLKKLVGETDILEVAKKRIWQLNKNN
jgi:hypothetical protein